MARQETTLSIFLASPSDVDEERECLDEAIEDFNKTWPPHLKIRFELLRGIDAIPSLGEEGPQSVINSQIPDYDLFIGIMWHRFGTPTRDAGSGTEEEFLSAKKRYDENPDSVHIMFYFKEAPLPVPLSLIDTAQIERVQKFKSSLGKDALYGEFQTPENFKALITNHLLRFAEKWKAKSGELRSTSPSVEKGKILNNHLLNDSEVDEMGFLDLVEESEVEFSVLEEITDRIAEATENVSDRMKERVTELNRFSEGPDSTNRKVAKRLMARVAADMDDYTHRIESEIPSFGQRLNSGIDLLTKAAQLSIEFETNNQNTEQIEENIRQINNILTDLEETEGNLENFRNAAASIPRMTTKINRSKRAMVNSIQQLIDSIYSAKIKLEEAVITLNLLLKK